MYTRKRERGEEGGGAEAGAGKEGKKEKVEEVVDNKKPEAEKMSGKGRKGRCRN